MKNNLLKLASIISVFLIMTSNIVFATNTYAQKGAAWILDGLFWVVIVVAIVLIINFLAKNSISKVVVTVIIASVIAIIIKNPTIFETIGNELKTILGL